MTQAVKRRRGFSPRRCKRYLWWTEWHWDRLALGQTGTGTDWHWDRVALGQTGTGTEWHWDRLALGQTGTATEAQPIREKRLLSLSFPSDALFDLSNCNTCNKPMINKN